MSAMHIYIWLHTYLYIYIICIYIYVYLYIYIYALLCVQMVCQNSVRVGILQALEAQAAPTLVITGPNFYVCVCVCASDHRVYQCIPTKLNSFRDRLFSNKAIESQHIYFPSQWIWSLPGWARRNWTSSRQRISWIWGWLFEQKRWTTHEIPHGKTCKIPMNSWFLCF